MRSGRSRVVKQTSFGRVPSAPAGMRSQYAALCWRLEKGKVRVLVITSRGTGRWIIPKGWPMADRGPHEAAAQEAWEEAGVLGKASDRCLGLYTYDKVEAKERVPCAVMVFGLKVKTLAQKFPEAGQRRRRWVSRKKAAKLVAEPELARLLRGFDPRKTGKGVKTRKPKAST